MEYKNKYETTGKVLNQPIKVFNKNIIEFDILYKETTKYRVNVSLVNSELVWYVENFVKQGLFVDVSGKLKLIPATENYSAYILIHATEIIIKDF